MCVLTYLRLLQANKTKYKKKNRRRARNRSANCETRK